MKDILIAICILPILLIKDVVKSQRSFWKKTLFIIILLYFISIWWGGYSAMKTFIDNFSYNTGLRDRLSNVPISGESMMPTIKSGQIITLNSPKKYGLGYGDIVSFQNAETGNFHYLKRIIGIPGDEISLKNGYVYVNGRALSENYTLNHFPTYGNTFLTDCEKLKVPVDSYFMMGDNRAVSFDSRAVGLVKKDDVDGVIKTNISKQYITPFDEHSLTTTFINPVVFLKKLNQKRSDSKLSLLVTHELLNNLASSRTHDIVNHFDTWKKEGISINSLLDSNGYRYNLVHEYVTFGYLSEDDIIQQIFENTQEKNQFLSAQYTEVGIGVTNRNIGECTYPVISIILSWPAVPTYDATVIADWNTEIININKTLSDLQSWVGSPKKDQNKVRQAINLLAQENQIAVRIHSKMKSREWLTSQDYADIQTYDGLVKQTVQLLNYLFPKNVQGISTETLRRL